MTDETSDKTAKKFKVVSGNGTEKDILIDTYPDGFVITPREILGTSWGLREMGIVNASVGLQEIQDLKQHDYNKLNNHFKKVAEAQYPGCDGIHMVQITHYGNLRVGATGTAFKIEK